MTTLILLRGVKMKGLFLILLVITSCSTPFKGGKYFEQSDQKVPLIFKYIFHENGQFETVIVRPGRVDIDEKGTWKARKNVIMVTVDTIYPFNKPPEKVSKISKFHRVPSDSTKLLIHVRAGKLKGKMTLTRYE